VISSRRRAVTRESLGPVPRLLGLLGLTALAAWLFSGLYPQPSPEKPSTTWVVTAQPAPKNQVSADPLLPSSLPIPEPFSPPPTEERPASTIITISPPYEFVDVLTIRAGGRTITLAGIESFAQNATCRARDGTRWSCAKLARDALRSRVGSQSLRCSTQAQASTVTLVAVCTTSSGYDLARVLVADGWARVLDDARLQYGTETELAEAEGLGLWGLRMEEKRKAR
jgi:endonuclease YncB( thermonuclease family)